MLLSAPCFINSISFIVIYEKRIHCVKYAKDRVPLTHIFPYNEDKRMSCSYKAKYGSEKTRILAYFTQWSLQRFFGRIQEISVITLRWKNYWFNCLISLNVPVSKLFEDGLITEIYLLNTGRKVNLHKTFRMSRTSSKCLMHVQSTSCAKRVTYNNGPYIS